MRLIPSSLQIAGRPRLACEIAPEAVFAAQSAALESPLLMARSMVLPENAVAPGSNSPVLAARETVQRALAQALEGVAGRSRQLTLVVPDACVRVLVLDFEALPNKAQEALPLVRFRLRKMLPFDAETAAVSYQVLTTNRAVEKVGSLRVMVAATAAEVRAEFEGLVRETGFEPGVLLPSTVAALAAIPETGAHMVVHTGRRSATTAITRDGDLLLYRTVAREELRMEDGEDDLTQAILMATAFYEDSLGAMPEQIWVAGHDTPDELQRSLSAESPWQIPLRSLVHAEHFLAEAKPNGIPACRFAGVVGALHG